MSPVMSLGTRGGSCAICDAIAVDVSVRCALPEQQRLFDKGLEAGRSQTLEISLAVATDGESTMIVPFLLNGQGELRSSFHPQRVVSGNTGGLGLGCLAHPLEKDRKKRRHHLREMYSVYKMRSTCIFVCEPRNPKLGNS